MSNELDHNLPECVGGEDGGNNGPGYSEQNGSEINANPKAPAIPSRDEYRQK